MPSLKIVLPTGDLRRVHLPDNATFADVTTMVREIVPTAHRLQYEDDESERITIGSEAEFRAALSQQKEQSALKLFVITAAEGVPVAESAPEANPAVAPPNPEQTVHRGTTCDSCGTSPIRGGRFQCATCSDFDLCESCSNKGHQHPLVRWAPAAAVVKQPVAPVAEPLVIHKGAVCDKCGVCPIKGDRFQCTVCSDFDLCGICAPKGHAHPLKKWSPEEKRAEPVRVEPVRAPVPVQAPEPRQVDEAKAGQSREPQQRPEDVADALSLIHAMDVLGHHHYHYGYGYPYHLHPGVYGWGWLNRYDHHYWGPYWHSGVHHHIQTVFRRFADESQEQQQYNHPDGLSCDFVDDITLPDRSEVGRGQTVVKTWKIKNNGKQEWPQGCRLVMERADGSTSGDLQAMADVPLRQAVAGEVFEVSVAIKLPEQPGRVAMHFCVVDKEDRPFGLRLWADLVVV
jgi:uncharacterized CHY-type Zn-finger protein